MSVKGLAVVTALVDVCRCMACLQCRRLCHAELSCLECAHRSAVCILLQYSRNSWGDRLRHLQDLWVSKLCVGCDNSDPQAAQQGLPQASAQSVVLSQIFRSHILLPFRYTVAEKKAPVPVQSIAAGGFAVLV